MNSCSGRFQLWIPLAAIFVAGAAVWTRAEPPRAASSATGPLSVLDTLRVFTLQEVHRPEGVWRRIRDEVRRIREPDVSDLSLLRYTLEYTVSDELASDIVEAARAEGLDPDLGFRLVRVESRFRISARGPSGALGLTQLLPSTARSVDPTLRSEADILNPDRNLRTGFRYLRRMIERYGGDVRLGLLAYNRGPGTVERVLRGGMDPENGYSRKVLGSGVGAYTGPGLLAR
ncbi:MAG: lytic transglycosylase domain-containing protein [Longimicrobiaceae bacterium]